MGHIQVNIVHLIQAKKIISFNHHFLASEFLTMKLLLFACVLISVSSAMVSAKCDADCMEAIATVVDKAVGELNHLSGGTYEYQDNGVDAAKCFWNDWQRRDQFADVQCTYDSGRFSHDRKFWGIKIGKWYCAFYNTEFKNLGGTPDCS